MLLIDLHGKDSEERYLVLQKVLTTFQTSWDKIESRSLLTLESEVQQILRSDPHLSEKASPHVLITLSGAFLLAGYEYISIVKSYPITQVIATVSDHQKTYIERIVSKIPLAQKSMCDLLRTMDGRNVLCVPQAISLTETIAAGVLLPYEAPQHIIFSTDKNLYGEEIVYPTSYVCSTYMIRNFFRDNF